MREREKESERASYEVVMLPATQQRERKRDSVCV